MAEGELTAKQASTAAVALVAVTTVGLVGASVSSGTAATIWAVGTVAAIVALAYRLRRAPSGTVAVSLLITGILVLSAGIPAVAVISEERSTSALGAAKQKAVVDPSMELRTVLAKAEELFPGSTNAILRIEIDENWTQIRLLDLAKGQSIWFQYSRLGTPSWNQPSRSSTTDRADAAFRAADIAGLDLAAAATKARAAATTLGVDRSDDRSDKIEIGRRSSDKRLVATIAVADFTAEADPSGNLPDNLALAKVDGALPVAQRLLRDNGIDPNRPVIDSFEYKSFGSNVGSVGPSGSARGVLEIRVDGPGRSGTLTEVVGRFPEIALRPVGSTSATSFALTAVDPAGIERARADVERRFSVPPIDAHAIGLEIDQDREAPSSRVAAPIMRVSLGPGSNASAYYRLDGAFVRTG
ncbi:hypothetical protein TTY48_26930 [Tsukamurella sp. TY48]|uniref:hypothetical protein n=1 Tax=Tsukamurella sp. TY48 TaxID=2775495 RepID=UPI001C7D161C|nr:hypothetical protein [Tsukamurella sp. TY48]GIZ98081.1 hypothetical protein TTY48_26930 [Tsukamurella sp. TY48]